jgi:hypothetical protein
MKLVYRARVVGRVWLPFGVVMLAVTALGVSINDSIFMGLGALGLLVSAYACWPVLHLTADGLVIRNLRSVSVPWADVRSLEVGVQMPFLGMASQELHRYGSNLRGRKASAPNVGLLVHTSANGTQAALAIRRNVLGQEIGDYPHNVLAEVTAARQAARRGTDPIAAAEALRAKAAS